MRIDKYLCDTLNISRTEAKKAIADGRVKADGGRVVSGSVQVSENTVVFLDGLAVSYQRYFYIMMNKPQGFICANRDHLSKTVFDLLPQDYRKKDLFVCGRLDKDTTGFVLLTNNGDLAHRLLAPKKHVYKEYEVTLRWPVSERDMRALEEGICLADGHRCMPAIYLPEDATHGLLRIREGKFHQIKRMFAALQNEVIGLHRRSIHGLQLDPDLAPGQCRYLKKEEIQLLEQE